MKTLAAWALTALGAAGALAFGLQALRDYRLLRSAYAALERVPPPKTIAGLAQPIRADALQAAHRLNLFANGTRALLFTIVAAIGIHALVTRRRFHN